uniref:Type-I PKS n=1 Tax=Streptomyces sp. WAC2288 TaxID=1582798 RepID=A0A1I9J5L1_9ACTN|nr:type-I PKS [Streptomyces sp. WAC2288]
MTAPSDKIVDALRTALRDNERLKQNNQRLEAVAREPIAIVGMACRLPGGADTPEKFWRLLADGVDAIGDFPDRPGWDPATLVDPDPDRRGTTYVSQGGFLHDADRFDAGFFGINPREALAMDPQQRLLLETAWEALERARIPAASLRSTATGVFVGATGQDYAPLVHQSGVETEGYMATGTHSSVASGRISYTLGLEGPAVTVDTACSTSLVTLHLAVQSLRNGECSLALAGGATLMASPATFLEFSRQRGLAVDGRCKAFSDSADGTGWSEGVGMLLLERLSDARRNGRQILAVIRGSAVNQDGASNGLTAPNGPSQRRVIREALASAGLTPGEVDAVEAHGTGTTLGDPIEAQALLASYGQDRARDRPLWLGSVKSNIGHTQAAAGVAGLMKMVLALRHDLLPKTLHVTSPSSHVTWSSGAVELLTEARPWPASADRPRRAGVSSFGMSGTNAHVIIEEAPAPAEAPPVGPAPDVLPWLLSGRTAAALRAQADALAPLLPASDPAALGWSLAASRARFEHRAVVLPPYGTHLGALASDTPTAGVVRGQAGPVGRTVLVFPGQGAQWAGMGGELLDTSPVFAAVVAECEKTLSGPDGLVDWSLTDALRDGTGLDRVEVVQPASFVVMVALAALWESYGVTPAAVVGHSQGEVAAAHVAGVLSLRDALRVVVARSSAIASLGGTGAVASLRAPAARVRALLPDGVSIAAVNAPEQIVVSATAPLIEQVLAVCEREGVPARRVAMDFASHSPAMEPLRERLLDALEGITPRAGRIPFLSTVTGEFTDPLTMGADYWYRNLREPVRFADAVERLAADGYGVFVEASSHPVLTAAVEETLERWERAPGPGTPSVAAEASGTASGAATADPETAADDQQRVITGTLRRKDGGLARFLASAAELWTRGVDVDWSAAYPQPRPHLVDLPTYPFQRRRYWPQPAPVEAEKPTGDPVDSAFWTAVESADTEALAAALGTETALLDPVLPALGTWRRRQREQHTADGWRYEVVWRPRPTGSSGTAAASTSGITGSSGTAAASTSGITGSSGTAAASTSGTTGTTSTSGTAPTATAQAPYSTTSPAPGRLHGTWLVVAARADAEGATATAVTTALTGQGATVHTLVVGDTDGDREALAVRLRESAPEPAGVLSLLALDERPDPRHPALTRGLATTMALTQALGDARITAPLWIATQGAVSIGRSDPLRTRHQAMVWGFGRVVGLEHPDRWGGLLDLPATLVARDAERLAVTLADGAEDQVALRGSGTFVRRLIRATPGQPERRTWQPHGTALITGGTGGIGSALARWFATHGIDHLVLTGRRGADAPGAAALRDELTALGVGVTLVACDTADRDALARVLDLVPEAHPLTTVVHAAGVGQFQELADSTPEDLADVLAAKVLGAAHLDDLLGDRPLDAFILFSSIAATWGSGGQSGYAAANAHLDALAERRRARGATATSIAWGAWGGAGLATDAGMARHLQARGIGAMDPALALAALRAAVERDETLAVVADMDWERFAPPFAAARPRPLLDELPEVRNALAPDTPGGQDDEADPLRRRLATLSPAERLRELLDLVRVHAAGVLGHDDGPAAIEAGRAFRDLGFDSLTAVELRNRLSSVTGLTLPATLVFDHAQPRPLARHLHQLLFGDREPAHDGDRTDGRVPALDDEPIAIIGMSCRLPGGVSTPDDLWRLVASGSDALSPFPTDRHWSLEGHPAGVGGFVHDAAGFDAAFFGISPREALAMDPQQRILLEAAWEALEHAGIAPDSTRGTRTGVFVGCTGQGYGTGSAVPDEVKGHLLVGNSTSVVSGRVAYALGLEGPAITLDTACSSSLVALHWASRSLRSGESSLALAGGVTVMATPGAFAEFERQGALASDGRCKAFSDDADGTGWAEGVGVLVLERLSDARRNGHRVLAVVRGSAVNQDGASNGLSAPNGPSQQRVIRDALASAGVTAGDVDVVEAHGTGTSLGDPIEAQALLASYGQDRDRPLWLGSVKSNIGHTQAAAGVAGVMKMVLALQRESLPKTLHVGVPSSHVDWSAGAVELLTEARDWPTTPDRPRRAGVSSFGVSGTNAHVIVEEAPVAAPAEPSEPDRTTGGVRLPVVPWLVSAKSADGVAAQAGRLLSVVEESPLDVGLSLAVTRSALEHRSFVVGSDAQELRSGLDGLVSGRVRASVAASGLTGVVFSGQGGQRVGMGRELAAVFPVFAEALEEVCAQFDVVLDRPLKEVLFDDVEGVLGLTGWAQPALFAVEVALFRLIESWGVRPDYLVGHSVGELAAAYVSGVVSLEDACRLVAARASLMQALPSGGAMWAVRASVEEVTPHLVDGVSVAAVNAPGQVVLSGTRTAVEQVAAALTGRQGRWLEVSHAFHSGLMDPMLDAFREVASTLTYARPNTPIVSTLSGEPVTEFTADYWTDQVRGTVRFADALTHLTGLGVTRFLEVGPDATLIGAIGETCGDETLAVALLRRDRPEPTTAVTTLARLWADGGTVDWAAFYAPTGAQTTDLPTYPFQHQRYWLNGNPTELMDPADRWSYQVDWRAMDLPPAGRIPGRWLVVSRSTGAETAESDPLAPMVADALRAAGAEPVTMVIGPDTDRATLAAALREHQGAAGVVALIAPGQSHGPGAEEAAATATLVQALGDAGVSGRLWAVTTGAVSIGTTDTPARPEAAAVWGLGRVAALEHPDRWGGLVDLPPTPGDHEVGGLIALLAGASQEDQVALRPGGSFARRLVRARVPRPTDGQSRALTGTVLVTGGTGALGAHVSRWLVDQGADTLVLVSRRGPDAPGADALRTELVERGATVVLAACDTSDRDALARLLADLDADGVRIDAVIHAAGVVDDGLLHTVSPRQLEAVWDAKATAARHLHDLLADHELSAFVLFSSFSGTFGAVGQAGYAAANAYLDALAESRTAAGLPALSVAWGPWAGGGMAADANLTERMLRSGLRPMDSAPALDALARVVTGAAPTAVVADVDWARLGAERGAGDRLPLIAELVPATEPDPQSLIPGAEPVLSREVRTLPPAARHAAVLETVRVQAADVLGHPSIEPVAPTASFAELGFDSLLAMDLRTRLKALTGLVLPATLLYDQPTADALATHLTERLAGNGTGPATATGTGGVAADGEPIAIVGMSCRFPGGVDTPEDLWRLLTDGTDAMTAFPEDRGWDLASLYHPDPDHEGTCYVKEGGFLRGAADFDADLFGINPREALAMDPQQRLLMECSWEALERAGIDPRSVRGSQIGVFAGTNGQDYPAVLHRSRENLGGYVATGNVASVLSGRISYSFGLEGPALTVDTACSASLVALHLAVQALRAGECEAALVGGATVMTTPSVFVEFSRQRALSADGRCKAFSDSADGTGWGEGVGVVLVERLSDARRKGHPVLAVVRGSAVNQDGASNGLTAPNGAAQQRVIHKALADAGLSATEVDAVEAHGTGTTLGDPIEAQALLATYGQGRPDDQPLWLGSIKSNLGHTQAAAGLAGVIKMVLALRHSTLPASLHVTEPSTHVDWASGAVRVLAAPRPWPTLDHPRRAGVSAFGVSGTNAHAILEEAPPLPSPDPLAPTPHEGPTAPAAVTTKAPSTRQQRSAQPRPEHVTTEAPETQDARPAPVVPWILSGRTPAALAAQADRLRATMEAYEAHTRPSVADVAWSLATTRASLEQRAAITGATYDEMASALTALATGQETHNLVTGAAGAPGKTVFVFPGQGSQWIGMAGELAESAPVFAAKLAECEEALAEFTDWRLTDVLRGAPCAPTFDRVDVVQPALFAVMVALAALWEHCGVRPHAVIGHSQGEIAAAHIAGALTLRDAARVVCLRSQALTPLAGEGGMVSLMLAAEPAAELIAPYGTRLAVAAVNGPASVVVSGDEDAVDELLRDCQARDIRARRVPVTYASHCAHVDRIHDDLLTALGPITPRRPDIPLLSTVTGTWADGDNLVDAAYWFRNLRQPVMLDPAIRALLASGHRTFIEISPHPVLTVPVQETLDSADTTAGRLFVGGSLRRDDGGARRFTTSLAEAHVCGVDLDWTAVFGDTRPHRVELPTYAFQRRTFWPRPAEETAAPAGDPIESAFWEAVDGRDTDELATTLGVDQTALTEVLPALATWRRARREAATLDTWRYRVEWRPLAPQHAPDPARLNGTWLLLSPTTAQDAPLPDFLTRALDLPGTDLIRIDLDPATATRETLTTLLRAHTATPITGVLSLLGTDEGTLPGRPAVPVGAAATLQLAQALADTPLDAPLWLITQGAVLTTPADRLTTLTQGQVWGLARVIGLEDPDRWGGLVDLPETLDDTAAHRLRHALAGASGEDQLAIRDRALHARRLVHAPVGDLPATKEWRPRDTALITGGTGGLGAHVARWLAASGTEHLVLTSRRGPAAPGADDLRAELTALGARVTIASCDTADRTALTALVESVRNGGDRIRTVVHAAGAVQATPLREMTLEEYAEVAAAKTLGAAHLDELFGAGADGSAGSDTEQDSGGGENTTTDHAVDHFVLFSSNAGVWGSGGQAAYAAANAYLDVLAQRRRERGLTATSVAWGAWGGSGMAATAEAEEQLSRRGVLPLAPDRALAALQQALEHDETVLTVADVDWARFAPSFAAARPRPLLAELPAAQRALRTTADEHGSLEHTETDPGERLRALPSAERDAALAGLARNAVAAVLGHDDPQALDPGRAFKDLGFDSLTSVQLRNRLTRATGITLPATLVFDHPTLLDLTALLRGKFAGEEGDRRTPEQSVLQDLDKLEAGISALSPEHDLEAVQARLRSLISSLGDRKSAGAGTGEPVSRQLEEASDDELFDFIRREFGR